MLTIDKSLFSAEELEQYEALIAKATVETGAEEEKEETQEKQEKTTKEEKEEVDDEMEKKCKKSVDPALIAVQEELETLKKSVAMKEFTEIAKKYAPLGKKEDELAQTLYDMKKSNEANYDAYITILDESLGIVEKSGLYAEIGKSARGNTSGGTMEKIEAVAAEIQKADPNMSRATAIAKAWEQSPELMEEYDQEYHK